MDMGDLVGEVAWYKEQRQELLRENEALRRKLQQHDLTVTI